MNASQASSEKKLKSELARFCLPAANRDPNRKLAWANSICLLFLLIGILGARQGVIAIKPVPSIREIVPIVVEPMTLPPQETVEKRTADDEKPAVQPVAVALPTAPNINFSVPTLGSLVVPAGLASAPPLEPLQTRAQIGSVDSTGAGGERPQPPYPKIALEDAEQGSVSLSLTGDAAGNVVAVDIKESSGFPVLDRATVDFIKRHWHLPADGGTRLFETSITYKLQLNF